MELKEKLGGMAPAEYFKKKGALRVEKALVLEFAQLLREKIEKSGKYRVAMTRWKSSRISMTRSGWPLSMIVCSSGVKPSTWWTVP